MANLNRMLEMHQGGCGVNQIAGVFQDNNIALESHQVKSILESHFPLCSKSLPKEVAQNAIKNNAQNKPFVSNGGLQPS